jgi:hypothetical protein
MHRIVTVMLAVVVAGTLSLSQATAGPKDVSPVKMDKATAKTDFSAVRFHGGYCSSCCTSYCTPCYSSYCTPCCTSYCSPCYSSYYSSYYYGGHYRHFRR